MSEFKECYQALHRDYKIVCEHNKKLQAELEETRARNTHIHCELTTIRAMASKGQREEHWLSDVLDDIFEKADRLLKEESQVTHEGGINDR